MNFEQGHFYHIFNRANSQNELLFQERENYLYFLKQYKKYLYAYFDTICYCLLPNHFHFLVKVKEIPLANLQGLPISSRQETLKVFSTHPNLQALPNSAKPSRSSISAKPSRSSTSAKPSRSSISAKPSRSSTSAKPSRSSHLKQTKDLEGLAEDLPEDFKYNKTIIQAISNLLNSYAKSFNEKYNRRGSLFSKGTKSKHIDKELYLQRIVRYIHRNPLKHKLSENLENWEFSSYFDFIELRKGSLLQKEIVLQNFTDLNDLKKFTEKELNDYEDDFEKYRIE